MPKAEVLVEAPPKADVPPEPKADGADAAPKAEVDVVPLLFFDACSNT